MYKRQILRLAGGDFNAILGFAGFACGILTGVFFLNKGYTLKRTYKLSKTDGFLFPSVQIIFLILLVAAPAFIHFTAADGGPGGKHAAIFISLLAGLIVGALAQRTRLCMVGGIRDMILFRDSKLLLGFAAILVSALTCNLVLTAVTSGAYFHPGFSGQPIAHTDGLWNFLGMYLTGFGCVLLGGCPLPVSYTHLDVYKRQDLLLPRPQETTARNPESKSSLPVRQTKPETKMCIRDRCGTV